MVKKILTRINTICGYIGGAFIVISALIMLYDVVMRYFLNSPSSFAPFIVAFLTLGALFFGVGYSFQAGAQIHIEILVDRLPTLPRRISYTIGYLFALFFVGALALESWKFTVKSYKSNWMTYGNVAMPSCILYGIMVFGCIILFLTIALALFDLWKRNDNAKGGE